MASIGQTPGLIIAAGVGAAASVALEPAFEVPRQDAWSRLHNRILDPGTLARLAAQGGVVLGTASHPEPGSAYDEALRNGYSPDKLDRLIYLAQTVPGVAEALRLWRHGFITDSQWTHALVKASIDPQYYPALDQLKTAELAGIGDVAYGVVRGILPAPPWVPVAPPATGDKVPRFPVVHLDPVQLAAELGFSEEMLQLMVGRSGLSMAPVMAAQAYFRGIIGPNDYLLAIAEGDLRTEWADSVREVSRQILTAGEYAQLQLRGFVDAPTRQKLTGLHGMSTTDSDYLYNVLGRAPAVHAVTTGLARGGVYPGSYANVPEPYRSAIQRSDIREEFSEIVYADRYTYPSGFQIKAETKDGTLPQPQAEELLLEVGWAPKWATFFSQAWAGGTKAVADPHVTKAENQLWTATHRSYTKGEAPASVARTQLAALGIPTAGQDQILALWDAEKSLVHAELTIKQLFDAYNGKITNEATGQPWSKADVMARLAEMGYSTQDADVLWLEKASPP